MARFLFLHVHKCAGTAVHVLMRHNIGRVAFYPPHWLETPKIDTHRQDPKKFAASILEANTVEREAMLLPFTDIRGFGGHNDAKMLDALEQYKPFSFTFLRDPLERLISNYFHYVFPEKAKHKRKYREQLGGDTFADYLAFDKTRAATDNLLVRVLSARIWTDQVTEQDLERAKEVLLRLDFVGFQDSFEKDVMALCSRADWSLPPGFLDAPIKKGLNRERMEETAAISPALAEPFIAFDRQLVDFAKALCRSGK